MTNANTYTTTNIPYFYVIRHIPSGEQYAGSKRGKGSNPQTLLQLDGYLTSSRVVHQLIEQDGLNSLEIVQIVFGEALGELSAYEYETNFLNDNECAQSMGWLNQHNNTGRFELHSIKARQYMLDKTGYEYPMQNPATKEKAASNNLQKYGVRYPTMLPSFVEHTEQLMLERTGYKNSLADPSVRATNTQKVRNKLGVDNPMQAEAITQARKAKMLLERGVDNPRKDPKVQAKIRQTFVNNYGVDNPMKDPSIQAKARETYKQLTGFDHCSQNPTVKAARHLHYLDQINRKIVQDVNEYLLKNGLRAKDIGLSRNWKRQPNEKIIPIIQHLL